MEIPKNPSIVRSSIFLLILSALLHSTASAPNTAVQSVLCNSGQYTRGDPFAVSLTYVLSELESATPMRQGYDFHNISPYPNALAYGHATCKQTLAGSDCAACLAAAKTALVGGCDSRIGARAALFDCTIRYEQYPFDD